MILKTRRGTNLAQKLAGLVRPSEVAAALAAAEEVADEEPNAVWDASIVECLGCGEYQWVAVHPLNCDNLECPRCGSRDTVREEIE